MTRDRHYSDHPSHYVSPRPRIEPGLTACEASMLPTTPLGGIGELPVRWSVAWLQALVAGVVGRWGCHYWEGGGWKVELSPLHATPSRLHLKASRPGVRNMEYFVSYEPFTQSSKNNWLNFRSSSMNQKKIFKASKIYCGLFFKKVSNCRSFTICKTNEYKLKWPTEPIVPILLQFKIFLISQ